MPYWIKKTISGSLICAFCGSLVIQSLGMWSCLENTCEKHADLPVEQQQGFSGWPRVDISIGTASQVSGYTVFQGTIERGGQ